ncbi:MAG: serine/threonine protein kinase [Planctomycetes bacterium]|nr:serine/threonine protein kinase [Planctomycetota bacterium]
MNANRGTCNAERIERLLSDQLSDDEQAAFEERLGVCEDCRRELEKRAAEPDVWAQVREFLPSIGERAVESDRDGRALSPSGGDLSSGPSRLTSDEERAAAVDAVRQALSPTDDPRMLGRLGGYEIAGVIGQGGMGVVLKGFDASLNRYVAIKVLAPHLASSGAARRRFAREAQAAAAVVHENVVAIHSVAEANGLPYFVMPYLRGPSLQKRLDEHGPLSVVEILRIAMQTAAGLAAAHAQGLVHRDIKPANILLEDGVERVQITDFGLARAADDASLTRTGVIAGTPQFMSPEQARGEVVDARSDLFSLGSVIYAMCTGRPPFRAETSYGVLRRITDTEPRPIREINPDIPEWLAAIVWKLHAKNPADRFQSADQVARLLQQCLAHVQRPTEVPLPDAVQQLVRRETAATFRPRRSVLSGLKGLVPAVRQRVRVVAGASIIAAAALLAFVLVHRATVGRHPMSGFAGPASTEPARRQAGANTSELDRASAATAAWEDRLDEQLDELGRQVRDLPEQTDRLWEGDSYR